MLRFATLALLDLRLMLADRGAPEALGVLPAAVVAVLAAVAIVTEEQPWVRRSALAFVAVDYAAWNLHAFGAWASGR